MAVLFTYPTIGAAAVAPVINNQTFNINDGYSNSQTVGTVALANSPSPAPSFSITAGNTGSAFAINASTGVITVNDELELDHGTTPTYSLTVQATNSAGSDTATVTVNVADATAETFLFDVTITNPLNSTASNQLARIPVLLKAGDVGIGQTINVYDDDGSGGKGSRLDNFDLHAAASDMNGDLRLVFANGIVPTLAASGTSHRKLKLYATSTTAPSGTALTFANLLDMDGMDNGGVVFEGVIGGTTYSADLKTMLTAGLGTFSKTAARCEIWQSGPCMLHFRGHMPLTNGGSAHASGDGLHLFVWGKAWKAGTGAYNNSTNPVIGLECWAKLENGGAERSSPANYTLTSWSLKRATSLTNATLITSSDTDPDGNTLTYNGSSASAYYGATWTYPVFIGQKRAIWAYGNHLDSGAKNTDDDAHGDYVRSTKLIPNYGARYADINHASGISTLNAANGDKMFPGHCELASDEGGTGPRNDIALIMWSCYEGIAKWNVDGRRRLIENARAQLTFHTQALRLYDTSPTNGARGVWPRWDNETGYTIDDRFDSDQALVPYPGSNASQWTLGGGDHSPCTGYAAYLMTGDPIWLESMEAELFRFHATYDPGYLGLREDMTWFGALSWGGVMEAASTGGTEQDNFVVRQAIQQRAQAWNLRTLWQFVLCNPDGNTVGNLVGTKGGYLTWYENNLSRFQAVAAANTGSGSATVKRWAEDGPRWIQGAGGKGSATWQLGYLMQALLNAHFAGMTNADLEYDIEWIAKHYDCVHLSTRVAYQYVLAEYYPWYVDPADDTTKLKEWEDYYQKNALLANTQNYTGRKLSSGNWTLGGVSGADRSLEAPSAAFGAGNWYLGGKVTSTDGLSLAVLDQVTNATTARVDIDTTTFMPGTSDPYEPFASTTIAAGSIVIPAPHPDDAETTRVWLPNDNIDYRELSISAMAMLKDYGWSTASADLTEMVTNWAVQGANRNEVWPRT